MIGSELRFKLLFCNLYTLGTASRVDEAQVPQDFRALLYALYTGNCMFSILRNNAVFFLKPSFVKTWLFVQSIHPLQDPRYNLDSA